MITPRIKITEPHERIATTHHVFYLLQDEFAISYFCFYFLCGVSIFPLRTLGCTNRSD